jgi:hypothetical protein
MVKNMSLWIDGAAGIKGGVHTEFAAILFYACRRTPR